MNPAVGRHFGFTADELIGRNVKILMPSPVAEAHDGYLARYLETGVRHIIGRGREVEGRRKDGSVFPVELSVSESRDGSRRFFTGILRDASKRKVAEERLRESEERLRVILDSAVEGILSFDESGIIEVDQPRWLHALRIRRAGAGRDRREAADPRALFRGPATHRAPGITRRPRRGSSAAPAR